MAKQAVGTFRVAGVVVALTLANSVAAMAQDHGEAPIIQPGAPGDTARALTAEQSLALGQSRFTSADVRFMQHMIVHHNQAVDMNALIAERSTHEGVRLMGQRIAISQSSEMELMRNWLLRRGQSTEADFSDHAHHGHHGQMTHDDHGAHEGAHEGAHDHDGGAMDMGGNSMLERAMAENDAAMHAGHGDTHSDHATDMDALSDVPLMPGMLSPRQMAELAASEGEAFDRLFLSGMIHHHQGAIDMVNGLLAEPGTGEDPELAMFLNGVVADQSAEILRMQVMLSQLEIQ